MNVKIKELRNKALEKYVFTDVDGDNNHGIKLNEEKFAELIIRECINIADNRGAYEVMDDIIVHFGVQE